MLSRRRCSGGSVSQSTSYCPTMLNSSIRTGPRGPAVGPFEACGWTESMILASSLLSSLLGFDLAGAGGAACDAAAVGRVSAAAARPRAMKARRVGFAIVPPDDLLVVAADYDSLMLSE